MDLTGRLVFGTGRLHWIVSPVRRQRLLARAIDLGFRSFDVAPAYGNGLNEVELGRALAGRRDGFRILTKFGIPVKLYGATSRWLFPGLRAADKLLNPFYGRSLGRRVFSPAEMERSLTGSLRRLRTDYVDTLLVHEPLAPLLPARFDELAATAERLKQKGLLREFGLSGVVEPVRPHLTHPAVDVIEAPLWEVEGLEPGLAARTVAYAVYRHFRASAGDGSGFVAFVREAAQRLSRTDFILSTSTEAGFERFAQVLR